MTKIYNIFLDFLNRDSREIYGVYDNIHPALHLSLLRESINIAVFLCNDFCIMPPGFLLEDKFVQKLFSICDDFTNDQLIRMPLKEVSLDDFFTKKEREYSPFKTRYSGLFQTKKKSLLKSHSLAIIPRKSNIGSEIITQWEEGPDVADIWKLLCCDYSVKEIEIIRTIPKKIYGRGVAVTWAAIEKELQQFGIQGGKLRYAVQNHYFNIYMKEFNLKTIVGLPYARSDFFLGSKELDYNYQALKIVLSSLNIWSIIKSMSAESLIRLRTKFGYMEFRETFARVARQCTNVQEVGKIFSLAATRVNNNYQNTFLMYNPKNMISICEDEISKLANHLNEISEIADECYESLKYKDRKKLFKSKIKSQGEIMSSHADVLIVTATKIESKAVLSSIKNVVGNNPKPVSIRDRVYHDLGNINEMRVFLVQSEMGSGGLGSSIQTVQKGISSLSPEAVIMTGIAFGINPKKQSIGDILVSQQLMLYELQRVSTLGNNDCKVILRGDRPHASPRLLSHFNTANLSWDEKNAKVDFGIILTGEKLVDNLDFREQLHELQIEALGGEMEGAGLYVACQDEKIDWILVKSICDWADGHKSSNKAKRQEVAAKNAADFVLHTLLIAPIRKT